MLDKLIILCGQPHSGTTLFNQSLCRHPQITGGRENNQFGGFMEYLLRFHEQYPAFPIIKPLETLIDEFYKYNKFQQWLLFANDMKYVSSKLDQFLPNVRFIVIHRDGRRAIASLKNRLLKRNCSEPQIDFVIQERSHRWNEETTKIITNNLPKHTLILKYDELLKNSPEINKTICDFCEIENQPIFNFKELVNSSFGILQPENYWQSFLTEKQQKICESMHKNLIQLGYAI